MDIKKPEGKFNLREFGVSFVKAIPALLVPAIIIGGVLSGFCTAIEAGAVACVAAFVVSLIYRELDLKKIPAMMLRTAISTGAIFLIIAFGNLLAWTMAKDGIADLIISAILAVTSNKYLIIFLILLLLVLVGCVLDMASATLIFIPVMFPLIQMIGMDVVHFGIVFSLMITIGMITPPVGQVLFITCNGVGRGLQAAVPAHLALYCGLLCHHLCAGLSARHRADPAQTVWLSGLKGSVSDANRGTQRRTPQRKQ